MKGESKGRVSKHLEVHLDTVRLQVNLLAAMLNVDEAKHPYIYAERDDDLEPIRTLRRVDVKSMLRSLDLIISSIDSVDDGVVTVSGSNIGNLTKLASQAITKLPDSELDAIVDDLILANEIAGTEGKGLTSRATRVASYRRALNTYTHPKYRPLAKVVAR